MFSQMGKDAKKLGEQLRYIREACREPRVACSAGVGRERNHARSHGLLAARCSNVQFNIAFFLTDFSAKERFLVVHQGINQTEPFQMSISRLVLIRTAFIGCQNSSVRS